MLRSRSDHAPIRSYAPSSYSDAIPINDRRLRASTATGFSSLLAYEPAFFADVLDTNRTIGSVVDDYKLRYEAAFASEPAGLWDLTAGDEGFVASIRNRAADFMSMSALLAARSRDLRTYRCE
jgi:hypothetical protein